MTVLVFKPIIKCDPVGKPIGTFAETYDRCEVVKGGTWSCGTRWYTLRNAMGDTFHATSHQVQED